MSLSRTVAPTYHADDQRTEVEMDLLHRIRGYVMPGLAALSVLFLLLALAAPGFAWGLKEALTAYKDQEAWARLRQNGMAKDYSWDRQGSLYVELYQRLAEG